MRPFEGAFLYPKSKKGGKYMKLKDTIDMMTSDDYKERFKAEYRDFELIPIERQNNLSSGSFKELIIKNY